MYCIFEPQKQCTQIHTTSISFSEKALYETSTRYLRFRILINPTNIAELPRKRILKYLLWSRIWCILLRSHLNGDIACCSSAGQIEAWTVVVVFGHCCVCYVSAITHASWYCTIRLTDAHSGISRVPLDVPTRPDAIIQIIERKYRPHQRIPWSAQRTLVLDVQRAIRLCHMAIMDINAIFVHESRIRAFPGRDASTTPAKLYVGVLDPECPEAVEEVCLSANNAVFSCTRCQVCPRRPRDMISI